MDLYYPKIPTTHTPMLMSKVLGVYGCCYYSFILIKKKKKDFYDQIGTIATSIESIDHYLEPTGETLSIELMTNEICFGGILT